MLRNAFHVAIDESLWLLLLLQDIDVYTGKQLPEAEYPNNRCAPQSAATAEIQHWVAMVPRCALCIRSGAVAASLVTGLQPFQLGL